MAAQVAESHFLNNKLVEVVAFMENISLKDGTEKDLFCKRLPSMIPAIPEPVAIRKVLPLLSNALEYGGAPATAVSSLLLIGRYGEKCTTICWSGCIQVGGVAGKVLSCTGGCGCCQKSLEYGKAHL
jgi:hypothetical protein